MANRDLHHCLYSAVCSLSLVLLTASVSVSAPTDPPAATRAHESTDAPTTQPAILPATRPAHPAATNPATHPSTRPATQPAIRPANGSAFVPTTQPVPGKLAITIWAPQGFIQNPTALSFDRQGRCYVAQTQRREGGELQTRTDPARRVIPDHSFQTVEDKFRWAGDGDPSWAAQTGGKKETITRLEDSKATGVADKASTFFEGFNQNGNDILAGVLWNDGNVYATLAPNLWLLQDHNNTGHADNVQSLSYGYGVHMSYSGHNMHGLTVGPDGKIYFSIGDKGLNVTTAEGKHLAYPWCGSVLRCNSDGTDLEVFAYGLRNVFEIAFDKYGNLFSVDNDGDMPGERERLVYITENSDTGWRYNWQYRSKNYDVAAATGEQKDRYNPWLEEKLWIPSFPGQAAYITPALANYTDGPCGFKYATEGSLDDNYAGAFFVVEFPKATIRAFRVKPKGASFSMYGDEVVSHAPQCTGLTFGPDGALYAAQWGTLGFKLANTGGVVKLDDPFAAKTDLRKETAKLLSEGSAQRPIKDLVHLLGHADMRVRMDAQFELAHRNAIGAFRLVAFAISEPQMARIHAMWGIGQLVDAKLLDAPTVQKVEENLLEACADPDAEIRAQAAKLVGAIAAKYGPMDDAPVLKLLDDASPRVRYFAAISMGKLKEEKAIAPLLKLAAENHPIDAFLRHGVVLGLTGVGDVAALTAATKNPSPDARIAAVVALRRLRNPAVMRFLNDRDALVATEAARAIHDDESIPEALPALAAAAGRSDITDQAFVRRALNANLRVGGAEQIQRLVRYATIETNPPSMRVEALDILANWEKPAVNDRVEGWYRVWPQRSGLAVKSALEPQVAGLLASTDHAVSMAATKLIEKLGIQTSDAVFVDWLKDANRPAAARVTALRLLAGRKYAELPKSIDLALASNEPLLRIEAMHVLSEQEPSRAIQLLTETLQNGALAEKQAAYRLLGEMKNKDANAQLSSAMDELLAGKVSPEVQLDLIEAAGETRNKDLRKKVKAWEEALPANDPLAMYSPALAGGDAERGKAVFMSHPEAACIRCHSTNADGTGSTVGPNLSGIGVKPDKTRHYILESMILPNAYIVPGYGMGSFKLKDGTEIAAQVKSETADALQLVDLEGKATTIKKSDVVSQTPGVSMMPAMGAILTRDEIRDVIEYLSSLK